MNETILQLISKVSGDAGQVVQVYIIWYFAASILKSLLASITIGGLGYGTYRLLKQLLDQAAEDDRARREGGHYRR